MATNTTNVHGMNVSGSDTTPDQFGHFFRDVFSGSTAGLNVYQNGTPNMTVLVAPGSAILTKNTVSSVIAEVKSATSVTISTANASNPRIDTIIIYEDTAAAITPYIVDGAGGRFKLASVVGTAAASPTVLSDAAIQTEIGAGKPWTRLADVTVAALTTTIINSNIADKRAPIATAGATDGFTQLAVAPTVVTNNGQRSIDLSYAGVNYTDRLSKGMRLRIPRTVAAPTQSTSLNGTNQFWNDTTVAGMTFTDDFVSGAWVKLSSYPSGTVGIVSRFNGTSGWSLLLLATGQVQIIGWNASGSNYSLATSYQSLPLNKWVHVAAQLDMSAFTATTTTSYVMFDGVDVPTLVARAGTNPTALIQAGNLEVGTYNAGGFFPGKIAQAFVSSAKITQANIRTFMNAPLTSALCTTHSIVSAYAFDGNGNDINTTNANNLTAQASATATNADSPFNANAYGIIMNDPLFSGGNTTCNVQTPEGYPIPNATLGTSSYSSVKVPYGFPASDDKWVIETVVLSQVSSATTANTWVNTSGIQIRVPIGSWKLGYSVWAQYNPSASAAFDMYVSLSTSSTSESNKRMTSGAATAVTAPALSTTQNKEQSLAVTTEQINYILQKAVQSGTAYLRGDFGDNTLYAKNALL